MSDYSSRVCNYSGCIDHVWGFDYYCPTHVKQTGWSQECRVISCKEPAEIGKVYCTLHVNQCQVHGCEEPVISDIGHHGTYCKDHPNGNNWDNRQHKESMEEKLERLGACGNGYPSLGLPCMRPKDHNPFIDCFALVEGIDGKVQGVYMQQDGKDLVDDPTLFPTDLVISKPFMKRKMEHALPDRRAAIAHTKAKAKA